MKPPISRTISIGRLAPALFLATAALALTFLQLSCATSGLTPAPHAMPAARAALMPEYRVFYDALQDYGDWTLIEPYGYVFRPRVAPSEWRPYGDGFWVPTDLYGWVWVSEEPFGWATYHYGQWFYDSYQGWVWMPGTEWAPSSVDWRASDSYVGWAPQMPSGIRNTSIPGGLFTYVPASQLGSTNLMRYALSEQQVGSAASQARPIANEDDASGVVYNRGPSIAWVERRTGPLVRAKVEDVLPASQVRASTTQSKLRESWSRKADGSPDTVATVRHAADRALTRWRDMSRSADTPRVLPVVRPFGVQPTEDGEKPRLQLPAPGTRIRKKAAAPDTTR